jgi:branched-chain amino acid transport system substrate-binding protein
MTGGKFPLITAVRRRRAAAVAVLCAVSLVAACSQTKKSSGSSSSSSPQQTTRTTRGVTDTSIKVGGMIYAAFFSGADVGAQARIARANREGGVYGRTIQFVGVTDTNNEQSNSLSITQRLVTQDKVFALLPVASSEIGIVDFAKKNRVPFFGYGIDPAFCFNEYAFGITGCVTDPNFKIGSNASGLTLKAFFKGDTKKTVAVIAEDFDAGRGGVKLVAASVKSVGFDVVYAKSPVPAPPAPVGDFSPFVTQVLKSNGGQPPDVIYGVLTGASAIGFYGAVKAAGFKGLTVIPSYDPRVVKIVDGAGALTQFAPYESASTIPQLQQMISDVKAVKPDQLLTVGVATGYWSTDMFLSLLRKTGKDLTVERLLAASNGFTYEAPGIVGKSQWPKNHDVPVPCATLSLAKDGKYVPTVPLTCGQNIQIR